MNSQRLLVLSALASRAPLQRLPMSRKYRTPLDRKWRFKLAGLAEVNRLKSEVTS